MILWAVHNVEAESARQMTVSKSLFLFSLSDLIGDISVKYSCELISADYCLTQSTDMIFWTLHHVEAESTCQADVVSVIVLVSTTACIGDSDVE